MLLQVHLERSIVLYALTCMQRGVATHSTSDDDCPEHTHLTVGGVAAGHDSPQVDTLED